MHHRGTSPLVRLVLLVAAARVSGQLLVQAQLPLHGVGSARSNVSSLHSTATQDVTAEFH